MVPTDEQTRIAAYHRWQRRGHGHGRHRDDWLAAEQDLLLALNYRILAHYPEDPSTDRPALVLGDPTRPICRFCEHAPPRTTFHEVQPALSSCLGVPGPLAADQCEECRAQFESVLVGPLEMFVTGVRAGTLPSAVHQSAYKALVRSALAILPPARLDLFPDALEWVANPDEGPGDATFADRAILLHTLEDRQAPWSALVCKVDDEAPMSHLIAFFGIENATIELSVPMCLRDEDLDGQELIVPRVPTIDGLVRDPGASCIHELPVSHENTRRRGRMISLDLP